MKKLFLFLIIIIILPIAALAYLGFVPGISSVLAKPKDLGIQADPALVTTFDAKHGMKNEIPGGVVPSSRQAEFTGSTRLDTSLSSAEVTSVLSVWKKRSPSLPIRDVQVRFNPDGTGEISGILEINTAITLAKTLGYSDADIEKGKEYAKYVSGDLPFYVKGVGGMTNNSLTLNPSTFELGRVTVPTSITTPAARAVESVIERRIQQVGGINVESLTMNNGSLQIKGVVPDTVK